MIDTDAAAFLVSRIIVAFCFGLIKKQTCNGGGGLFFIVTVSFLYGCSTISFTTTSGGGQENVPAAQNP